MNQNSHFVPWQLPHIGDNQTDNLSVLQRSTASALVSAREVACKEGYEAGLKKGIQEVETLRRELKTLLEQLHQPLQTVDSQIEKVLLELVMRLTKSCLQAELKLNPELVQTMIIQCLTLLKRTSEKSTLKMHADDAKQFKPHLKAIGMECVEIEVDSALSRGEFQFFSSQLTIDSRVENYLGDVSQDFLCGSHE